MKKGFTLVELLLYMVILASMLGVLSSFIFMTYQVRIKAQTVAEVEQQGNQTMEIITQTIRNATAINSPVSQSNAASLSINTVSGPTTPTAFVLAGSRVTMTEGAGASTDITSSKLTASGLVFTNTTETGAPGSVRVQFTLTYNNVSGTNEYDCAKTFYATASLK